MASNSNSSIENTNNNNSQNASRSNSNRNSSSSTTTTRREQRFPILLNMTSNNNNMNLYSHLGHYNIADGGNISTIREMQRLLRVNPERYMLHTLTQRGNDGEAGDVGDVGDFNHFLGAPPLGPVVNPNPNQDRNWNMPRNGGGDADFILDPVHRPHQRGAGDAEDAIAADVPIQVSMPLDQATLQRQLETAEQRRERSVQQILRLCDFIQEQLATIAAQIETYEKRLSQRNAPAPPEPDGDAL